MMGAARLLLTALGCLVVREERLRAHPDAVNARGRPANGPHIRPLFLIEALNGPDQRLGFCVDVAHAGLAQVDDQQNPA
jgi:hypothetical protein